MAKNASIAKTSIVPAMASFMGAAKAEDHHATGRFDSPRYK
jgi:hypothetical protein